MSKIKTITVSNLKAVSNQTANFDGCTAIITGGNNKGKTSFLRTTIDRIKGIKPSVVLKMEEKEGFGQIELTDGCKFRWEFKEGNKEKLVYITEKEIKTAATREICDRYFPGTFDVDKFLNDTPVKQRKALQDLVGLDFTDVDARYKVAYDERTAANTRANDAKILFEKTEVAPKFEPVIMKELTDKKEKERERLNKLYQSNKSANDKTRQEYKAACDVVDKDVKTFNDEQKMIATAIENMSKALNVLEAYDYKGKEVSLFIAEHKKLVKPEKIAKDCYPSEPTDLSLMPDDYTPEKDELVLIKELPDDKELKAIDQEIVDATETNRKAKLYSDWIELQEKVVDTKQGATDADLKVKAIETERMTLIKSAKMPEGFAFTDDGISYNGLSFTRDQLSSSSIYIAALKLGAMGLGEVRTQHFDASFLDNKSLAEVEAWATSQDLQLLIEQPDREGGEIEYQIIEA